MAQFRVHRVRFYEPELPAIHCIIYNDVLQKIALSRSDGSIEVWNFKTQCLFREAVIPPQQGGSIEALAWCQNRLFSVGLTGKIVEYDLLNLKPKSTTPTSRGACWSLAVDKTETKIAVCTEEGYLCLYQVFKDELSAEKPMEKQEGRLMCLSWHESGEAIATGSMNAIRVWNVNSGRIIQTITVDGKTNAKDMVVWCVAFTRDFQIISGDSNGKICFWDSKLGVLIQSIASHSADVLCLMLDDTHDTVWASGVDPTIICFKRNLQKNPKKWVNSTVLRHHTHDVRALAKVKEFLASGGIDCKLALHKYPPKVTLTFPLYVQGSYVIVAPIPNLILLQYSQKLELWRLGNTRDTSDVDQKTLVPASSRMKLVELSAKAGEVITSSAISVDGRWLAYSTSSGVRIFSMQLGDINAVLPKIELTKVRSLSRDGLPAVCLAFSCASNTELVSLLPCGTIQIFGMDLLSATVHFIKCKYNERNTTCGSHLLSVSSDGLYAAVGNHDGQVLVYNLRTRKEYFQLPRYRYQATAMAFIPETTELVVAYQNRKIIGIDLVTQAYVEWSNNMSLPIAPSLPNNEFVFSGITFSPANPDFIIFHDMAYVYLINRKVLSDTSYLKNHTSAESLHHEILKVSKLYMNLMQFISLRDDFAVALELQPITILGKLPAQLKKKKYGT